MVIQGLRLLQVIQSQPLLLMVGSLWKLCRIHFIAGVILTSSFIFRFAGALWNRGDRLLPKFRQNGIGNGLKETTLHYLMIPQNMNIIGFVTP